MSRDICVQVECEAQDHLLMLRADSVDDIYYISIWTPEFYARQGSFFSRWLERVKLALTALLGKEYCLQELVVSQPKMETFIGDLEAMVTKESAHGQRDRDHQSEDPCSGIHR